MTNARKVRARRIVTVALCAISAMAASTLPAVAGASALPGGATAATHHRVVADDADVAYGPVPPLVLGGPGAVLPGTSGQFALPAATPQYTNSQGAAGIRTTAAAPRAKVVIRVPPVLATVYIPVAYRLTYTLPQMGRPKPIPNPPEFQSKIPGCIAMSATAGSHLAADAYIVQPKPGGQPLGVFPPTEVSILAFGAIPVTATVHLSQVVNGRLEPLQIDQYIPGGAAACDPALGAKLPLAATIARGVASMTLSDVRVDGQPIDVGKDCRAVSPLKLNLWGDGGANGAPVNYYPGQGGALYQREDHTREDVPGGYEVHPGSSDLTIPPFTGCSANGEDFSRLITAAVSGPGNQLAINQGQTTVNYFDINDPTACLYDPSTGTSTCPVAPPYIPVPAK